MAKTSVFFHELRPYVCSNVSFFQIPRNLCSPAFAKSPCWTTTCYHGPCCPPPDDQTCPWVVKAWHVQAWLVLAWLVQAQGVKALSYRDEISPAARFPGAPGARLAHSQHLLHSRSNIADKSRRSSIFLKSTFLKVLLGCLLLSLLPRGESF